MQREREKRLCSSTYMNDRYPDLLKDDNLLFAILISDEKVTIPS